MYTHHVSYGRTYIMYARGMHELGTVFKMLSSIEDGVKRA